VAAALALAGCSVAPDAGACSCGWNGPFFEVAPQARIVVRAKVLGYDGEERAVPLAMGHSSASQGQKPETQETENNPQLPRATEPHNVHHILGEGVGANMHADKVPIYVPGAAA